jgi:hypothetical protein
LTRSPHGTGPLPPQLAESFFDFSLPRSSVIFTVSIAFAFLPFFSALAIFFASFDFLGFSFRFLEEPGEMLFACFLSLYDFLATLILPLPVALRSSLALIFGLDGDPLDGVRLHLRTRGV